MSQTLLQRIQWVAEKDPQTGQVTAYATDILELIEDARGVRSQWRTECGHLARLTVNGVCADCRIIKLEAELKLQREAVSTLDSSVSIVAERLFHEQDKLAKMDAILRRIEAWLIEHDYDFSVSNGVRHPNDLYIAVCNALELPPHWEREAKP